MKTILMALFAALSATSSFASTSELPVIKETSQSIYTIENMTGLEVGTEVPRCPKFALCTPISFAIIHLTLNGCMDTLGPVTYLVERDAQGKFVITVSALAIADKVSTEVLCFTMPSKSFTVTLGSGFIGKESVTVKFLDQFAQANK